METLQELIADMNVPSGRRADIHWLARNLGINNKEHKNFDEANNLIKRLLKS